MCTRTSPHHHIPTFPHCDTSLSRPNLEHSHAQPCNSYAADEDDMVKDPWLAEHLLRFGIDIMCAMAQRLA